MSVTQAPATQTYGRHKSVVGHTKSVSTHTPATQVATLQASEGAHSLSAEHSGGGITGGYRLGGGITGGYRLGGGITGGCRLGGGMTTGGGGEGELGSARGGGGDGRALGDYCRVRSALAITAKSATREYILVEAILSNYLYH